MDPRTKDALREIPLSLKRLEEKIDEQSLDIAEIVITLREIAKKSKIKVNLKGIDKLKSKKEEE